MYINTDTPLLFFLKFTHKYLFLYIFLYLNLPIHMCVFACIWIHTDESSPLLFSWKPVGIGNLFKAHCKLRYLNILSQNDVTAWSPAYTLQDKLLNFLFNVQLCFHPTVSKWMCKHSVPNKSELNRLPFWNGVLRFPAQVHQIILTFLLVFFTHLNKLFSFMPSVQLKRVYLPSIRERQSRT